MIKSLFLATGQEQSHGRYCVRFFKDGNVRRVIVDDLLPCSQQVAVRAGRGRGQRRVGAHGREAYAKLHGTYEALSGGTVDYALRDLTGGHVETIDGLDEEERKDSTTKDKLWDKLRSKLIHGYVCATRHTAPPTNGSNGVGEKQRSEDRAAGRDGLVLGYTYSVLELHREVSAGGEKIRLVRLRIPPGSYRGAKKSRRGKGNYPGTNRGGLAPGA